MHQELQLMLAKVHVSMPLTVLLSILLLPFYTARDEDQIDANQFHFMHEHSIR
jgi:hypothetical protein